jgi:hypothetical protein
LSLVEGEAVNPSLVSVSEIRRYESLGITGPVIQQWKELLAFKGIETGFTVNALKLNDQDSLNWQGHWRALLPSVL